MTENTKKITWFTAVAAVVIILDQWTKTLVRTTPDLQQKTLVEGWLALNFTTNPGMAMGISWAPTWVISIVAIIATCAIVWYSLSVMRFAPVGFMFCMGLIVGGALGNILDRFYMGFVGGYGGMLQGHVVDFIHFKFVWPGWMPLVGGNPSFPYIFNVADVAISTAIIVLLVFAKWLLPNELPKSTEVKPPAESQSETKTEAPESVPPTDAPSSEDHPAKPEKPEPGNA